MSIILQPFFWDEQAAHAKLERIVWPNGPVCPHCGATDRIGAVTGKGARAGLKFCCHCRKQFRATMGTMFEGSHVPLHKWFQASFLLTAANGGISAHQLHLRLEVTNKTALVMVHRLDQAFRAAPQYSVGAQVGRNDGRRRRVRWRRSARATPFAADDAMMTAAGANRDAVPWVEPPNRPDRQFLAFVETARELGYSEDAERFDVALQFIAHQPPPSHRHETPTRNAAVASEESAAVRSAPGDGATTFQRA